MQGFTYLIVEYLSPCFYIYHLKSRWRSPLFIAGDPTRRSVGALGDVALNKKRPVVGWVEVGDKHEFNN